MSGLVLRLMIRAKVIIAFALILCDTICLRLFPVQRSDRVNAATATLQVG
jgi:hypothetical protein